MRRILASPASSSKVMEANSATDLATIRPRFEVLVQRERWYGWQTVHAQWTPWGSSAFRELVDVAYDCSGDGTYTYRMVSTGEAAGGTSTGSTQSLNYLRKSC